MMKCLDPRTNVYYPRHDEYVGHVSLTLVGRCTRCREITDPAAAARATAEIAARDAAARRDAHSDKQRSRLKKLWHQNIRSAAEQADLDRLVGIYGPYNGW